MNVRIKQLQLHFDIDGTRGWLADVQGDRVEWLPIGGQPALKETRELEVSQMNVLIQAFIQGGYNGMKALADDKKPAPLVSVTGKKR